MRFHFSDSDMQIVLLINGISFLVEHFMKSVVGYKNKMQIEMIKNRNGGFRQKKKKSEHWGEMMLYENCQEKEVTELTTKLTQVLNSI